MGNTAVVFDILARDRASSKFDTFGNKVDSSGSKLRKLTGFMKSAGKAAALGLGAGLLAGGYALAGMTKNAMEDEAAQRRLAIGMRNATNASDAQIQSVEDWIAKVGVAKGVTDDELRPAFQRLVQATGDVHEAQRQLNIAMDVSEGTGKSLKTVTEALMKANNGTTASLSKLGLKTKDAKGNTLSFKDALASMANTFKGQAAKHAASFEGKMDRLKLIFDETKEAIGMRLIPMLSDLGGWILNTGIPKFVALKDKAKAFLQIGWEKLQPAIDKAKQLGDKIKGLVGFFRDLQDMDPGEIGEKIGTAFSSALSNLVQLSGSIYERIKDAFKNVDWVGLGITVGKYVPALLLGLATGILNFDFGSILMGIKDHWGEILLGVLAIAFAPSKMATGLAKILGKIPFVGKFLAKAVEWLNQAGGKLKSFGADLIKTFWTAFTGSITKWPGATIATRVVSVISRILPAVSNFFSTLGVRIGVWALNAFEKMGTSAGRKVDSLLTMLRGVPGKIVSALGNVGSLLLNAGKSIIGGLISGVTSKLGELYGLFKKITDKIPDIKGPEDKDRKLLNPAGRAIMEGLIDGIQHGWAKARSVLDKISAYIKRHQDKLKDLLSQRAGITDSLRGFASSIFSTDLSPDEEGGPPKGLAAILAFGRQRAADAAALRDNIKSLIGKGLSKDLLRDLVEQGAGGQAQIAALAAGSAADIAQANADNAATMKALKEAGEAAGAALFNQDIADEKRAIRQAKILTDYLEKLLEKERKNTVIKITLDGKELRWSLARLERQGT